MSMLKREKQLLRILIIFFISIYGERRKGIDEGDCGESICCEKEQVWNKSLTTINSFVKIKSVLGFDSWSIVSESVNYVVPTH
jgi:hypothetical protein